MAKSDEDFTRALQGKKIPILTLDNNWHRLFTQTNPTPEIKVLESEVNELLKKQARLTKRKNDLTALKRKTMDEIVGFMDDISKNDEKVQKLLDEKKSIIEQVNDKLKEAAEDYYKTSKLLESKNFDLMLATMDVCYDEVQSNYEEILNIEQWVTSMRIELKKNLAEKETKTSRNHALYTYMKNIFGTEVIDIFDLNYHVDRNKASGLDLK